MARRPGVAHTGSIDHTFRLVRGRRWILTGHATAVVLVAAAAFAVLRVLPLSPTGAIGLEALAAASVLGLLALAGAALSEQRVSARLGLGPGRFGHARLAALVVGFLALSHALDVLLEETGLRHTGALAELDAALEGASPRQLAALLVALALAPGGGEELFFRGLVQRGIEPRGGAIAAIAISSAAFGVFHLDLVHGSAAFVLGVYLGTVVHHAGSIRPAILCHVLNNGVAVLESGSELFRTVGDAPVIAVGSVLAVAGLGA